MIIIYLLQTTLKIDFNDWNLLEWQYRMTIQILFLALKFEMGLKYIISKSIKNYSVMVNEILAFTQEKLMDDPFVFGYIFKSKAVSHRKVQVCDKFVV